MSLVMRWTPTRTRPPSTYRQRDRFDFPFFRVPRRRLALAAEEKPRVPTAVILLVQRCRSGQHTLRERGHAVRTREIISTTGRGRGSSSGGPVVAPSLASDPVAASDAVASNAVASTAVARKTELDRGIHIIGGGGEQLAGSNVVNAENVAQLGYRRVVRHRVASSSSRPLGRERRHKTSCLLRRLGGAGEPGPAL